MSSNMRRAAVAIFLLGLVGFCAAQDETPPAARFAAIIFESQERNEGLSESGDVRLLRFLLEDPMVGDFNLVSIDGSSTTEAPVGDTSTPGDAAGSQAASFYYFFGAPTEVSRLPGLPKVIVSDRTVSAEPSDEPPTPGLTITTDGEQFAEFEFSGEAGEEYEPVSLVVQALRGRADANRDRNVTVTEFADFLSAHSDVANEYDLGALGAVGLFRQRTLEQLVEDFGTDGALSQAGVYADQERWIDSYLVLREISEQKNADPEYRRISELTERNLALGVRYSAEVKASNIARDVEEAMGFISKMITLANVNYVDDVDNRALFEAGLTNLETLLANSKLRRELVPEEGLKKVDELLRFISETRDRVYEAETLSESDFRTRIRRVMAENEATAGLPEGVIVTEFLYGIPGALDPNSAFIPTAEYKEFQSETVGHFGGLGIEITLEEITLDQRALTVITPLDGTPAAEAGLLPGDRIVAIDGESTEGIDLTEAVGKLRGPVGTKVTVSVVHRFEDKPVDVTITRGVIRLESVKGYEVDKQSGTWNYLVDRKNGIGYIRLTDFKEDTPDKLDRAVTALLEQGMKALVLDLRFNHGGLLESGVKVADRFLSEGTIVTVKSSHQRAVPFRAHFFRTYEDFPIAVIVNEQTASAAEILAGALRDNARAMIVGTRTFGKGTVQTVYELNKGKAAFKLTTAKYYTPNGVSIHREPYSLEGGLTADFEVDVDEQEAFRLVEVWHLRGLKKDARERLLERERKLIEEGSELVLTDPDEFVDRQLEKAIEVIRLEINGGAQRVAERAGRS